MSEAQRKKLLRLQQQLFTDGYAAPPGLAPPANRTVKGGTTGGAAAGKKRRTRRTAAAAGGSSRSSSAAKTTTNASHTHSGSARAALPQESGRWVSSIVSFGSGLAGQLGHGGAHTHCPSPVVLQAGAPPTTVPHEKVRAWVPSCVACGGELTLFVEAHSGCIFACGRGALGWPSDAEAAGIATVSAGASTARAIGVPVGPATRLQPPRAIPALVGVVQVACGSTGEHAAAILRDGCVVTWGIGKGRAAAARLGHGSSSSGPLPAVGATAAPPTAPPDRVGTSASYDSASAIAATASAAATAVVPPAPAPVPALPSVECARPRVIEMLRSRRVTAVACGAEHTALIVAAETAAGGAELLTFGVGRAGQLGHGDTQVRYAPTRVEAPAPTAAVTAGAASWTGDGILAVCCGMHHTVAVVALAAGGTGVFAWGWGEHGRLGLGDTAMQPFPKHVPLPEGNATAAPSGVAAGAQHTLAWTEGGELFGWGGNAFHQLGAGAVDCVLLPHRISIGRGGLARVGSGGGGRRRAGGAVQCATGQPPKAARLAAASAAAGEYHSAVITTCGRMLTFGWGAQGQLGHGCESDQARPRLVLPPEGLKLGASSVEPAGNMAPQFCAVATGKSHTVALLIDPTSSAATAAAAALGSTAAAEAATQAARGIGSFLGSTVAAHLRLEAKEAAEAAAAAAEAAEAAAAEAAAAERERIEAAAEAARREAAAVAAAKRERSEAAAAAAEAERRLVAVAAAKEAALAKAERTRQRAAVAAGDAAAAALSASHSAMAAAAASAAAVISARSRAKELVERQQQLELEMVAGRERARCIEEQRLMHAEEAHQRACEAAVAEAEAAAEAARRSQLEVRAAQLAKLVNPSSGGRSARLAARAKAAGPVVKGRRVGGGFVPDVPAEAKLQTRGRRRSGAEWIVASKSGGSNG